MRPITAVQSLTLDGVMQGLGRPDEDTRDGFDLGGWGPAYADHVQLEQMAIGSDDGALLFGARTYADFAGFWPHQTDNPFTDHLTATTKHVVSSTLTDADLTWANSHVVGDLDAVAALRRGSGEADEGGLTVLGSGVLCRALLDAGLVDTWVLQIHPVVLGSGRRLFEPGRPPTSMRLVSSVPTTTGVVIATYETIGAYAPTPDPGA